MKRVALFGGAGLPDAGPAGSVAFGLVDNEQLTVLDSNIVDVVRDPESLPVLSRFEDPAGG